MSLLHRLAELRDSGDRGVLFTVVEGDGVGGKELLLETGERVGGGVPEEATGQFDELVRRGRNKLLSLDDDGKVFAEWYGPPPRVFVYGAVDTAEALCKAAKLLGWTAIVGDARAMFLTPERMPSADGIRSGVRNIPRASATIAVQPSSLVPLHSASAVSTAP